MLEEIISNWYYEAKHKGEEVSLQQGRDESLEQASAEQSHQQLASLFCKQSESELEELKRYLQPILDGIFEMNFRIGLYRAAHPYHSTIADILYKQIELRFGKQPDSLHKIILCLPTEQLEEACGRHIFQVDDLSQLLRKLNLL